MTTYLVLVSCSGSARVYAGVLNLVVLVILKYVPGF